MSDRDFESKSEVQSVVFDKKYFKSAKDARTWLTNNNFKPIKRVDKKANTLRYRITDPKQYKDFRMKKIKKGISLVLGFPK